MAERREPDAFLGRELRLVVGELVVEQAYRMAQADDRGVLRKRDRRFLAEAVGEERFARGVAEPGREGVVEETADGRRAAVRTDAEVGEGACRRDVVQVQLGMQRKSGEPFPVILDLETGHVLQRLRLEGGLSQIAVFYYFCSKSF